MLCTVLATKGSVEVDLVDFRNCTSLSSMEQPALILSSSRVVGIEVFLLGSVLSIQGWILDALDFDDGRVITALRHCLVKLGKNEFVPLTSSCEINHPQWSLLS